MVQHRTCEETLVAETKLVDMVFFNLLLLIGFQDVGFYVVFLGNGHLVGLTVQKGFLLLSLLLGDFFEAGLAKVID